jgi:hypothetical protein
MEEEPKQWQLRLYVAGQTPKSLTALANLKRICEEHLTGQFEIELIDLLDESKGSVAQFRDCGSVIGRGEMGHAALIEPLIELVARRRRQRGRDEQQRPEHQFAQDRSPLNVDHVHRRTTAQRHHFHPVGN